MPKPIAMAKPKAALKEAAVIKTGASAPSSRVQLSLYTTQSVADRIETARRSAEHLVLDRSQWLAQAVIEKLLRDGF